MTSVVLLFVGSPLVVMLRELVEIDNPNRTENGPTSSSVSILLSIFRAVQKAQDLADSDITLVCLLAIA
jgi:sister-chromatid-cohesion protein PDS5